MRERWKGGIGELGKRWSNLERQTREGGPRRRIGGYPNAVPRFCRRNSSLGEMVHPMDGICRSFSLHLKSLISFDSGEQVYNQQKLRRL